MNDDIAPAPPASAEIAGSGPCSRELPAARVPLEAQGPLCEWSRAGPGELCDRLLFETRLGRLLQSHCEHGTAHVLCQMTLDQLELINDACGHHTGDEFLNRLTQHLAHFVRPGDTVAPLRDAEIGVLLPHCSMQAGAAVAETLRQRVEAFRFIRHQRTLATTASVGLVNFTHSSSIGADLTRMGAAAASLAREAGGNCVHRYQENSRQLLARRAETDQASRLQQAIDEKRLLLYAQPIVPATTDRYATPQYELLIRMVGADGVIHQPATFLPAAERYGLVGQVDRWVIQRVVETLAAHPESHRFTINVSGASLSSATFRSEVLQQLTDPGFAQSRICFELTETAVVTHVDEVRAFMSELREMGCRFALDDCGSGYSSFAYLRRLPFDYLKIDRQFVSGIDTDPANQAIVECLNNISHVFGLETIAEGVEDIATVERLLTFGVDHLQGFHLGKPGPLENYKTLRHRSVFG